MKHKGIQRLVQLQADASGNPPDSIHLMSVGHWHAPWHGNFEMTSADLAQMVVHFEEGEATVEGSNKLPVNYGHDISGKAAGWITKLHLESGGLELWGDIEWTPEGKRMLTDGEFKYISPEWNPRSFPYQDPEDEERWLDNVFTGAGLTNIPLFKKLKPVMASIVKGGSDKPTKPEGGDMDLKEVRVKKPEDLSNEEKAFLAEHKTDLTDDERKTFGLEEAPTEPTEPTEPVGPSEPTEPTEPSEPVKASTGVVSISASELASLKAAAQLGVQASAELRQSRLTASVDAAISRGAVKSGQKKDTINLLMASSAAQEKNLLDFISNLPDNSLLASEKGDGGSNEKSASDELNERAAALAADKGISYVDAIDQTMKADSDLSARVIAERK